MRPADLMRLATLLERHDGDDRDRALRDSLRRVLEARAGGRGLGKAIDDMGAELLAKLEAREKSEQG